VVHRPLVVRCGALGDLVQLSALLAVLERATPESCDLVLSNPSGAELLALRPRAGAIRRIAGRRRPYLLAPDQRRLVRWMRAERQAPVVVIETVAAAQAKMRRLMLRGGVAADDLVDGSNLPPRGELEHTLDYLRRIADAALARLGAPPTDPGAPFLPDLVIPASEVEAARAWLSALHVRGAPPIVVHASSRRANRGRWPDDRWARLLHEMARRRPDAAILLPGLESERPEVERLVAAADHPRVLSAVGELPVPRLAALLRLADSFVGLDSGPGHLAAAAGCPATLLFGRAHPRRVTPRGEAPVEVVAGLAPDLWPDDVPTWERTNRIDAIEVDEVLAAWERAGSRPASPARRPR